MAGAVDEKLLRQTKFPPEFNQKVDMQKVNIEVMKKWIAGKISEILGAEDDVVIELCFNLIEGSRFPNIKVLQIQLTGFLEKDTAAFCKELWTLCLSAQSNPQGVPKELLEAKKLELIQEKITAERAADAARQRREQERNREREMDHVRQRERAERGDRNRSGPGRGPRDNRDSGRRGPRDYYERRSPPPPRRRSPDGHRGGHSSRRGVDTYIPGNHSRLAERHRNRSPQPSRSPPLRRTSRRSESNSTSRSPSRSARNRRGGGYRGTGPERQDKRDADHAKRDSSERSRSPPSRSRRKQRSTSPSSSSDTSTHRRGKSSSKKHHRRPRSRSSSTSSDSSSTPQRRNKAREERKSPSSDDPDVMKSSADTTRVQQNKTNEQSSRHISAHGRSPSPKRPNKRRPSMDRYEPRAKRRKSTSSEESRASASGNSPESN